MFKATCSDLQFMHVVVFSQDPNLFILAREQITNKVCLFLIVETEEKIYQRNSRFNYWSPLEQEEFSYILQSVCRAMNSGLTVLKIDGKADSIINISNN
jgi:hypothetical protein